MEEVSIYDQDIEFVVGFAGSGKSTELAKQADESCIVLVPTHEARKVLERKGVENVVTIHSLLKLVPTLNQNFRKGQKLQTLKRIQGVDLEHVTRIIIDEYYMIPTKVLDLLLELLPDTVPVTLFGDPFQLEPVDGEPIDALAYTDNIRELTVQHRAKSSASVEWFMRLMYFIKDSSCKDISRPDGVKVIDIEELPEMFNSNTDRIIAYTNAKVIELNSMITAPDLVIGDTILINGLFAKIIERDYKLPYIYPAMISKGQLKLDLRADIEYNLRKYNGIDFVDTFQTLTVEIEDEPYNISYDLNHYNRAKKYEADVIEAQLSVIDMHKLNPEIDLPKWCRLNKGAKGVRARGVAWSWKISHTSHVFDLRYPFATTVHKAQGQEFARVFVHQENMQIAVRNGYFVKYARLLYVALSRAIEEVIIIKG